MLIDTPAIILKAVRYSDTNSIVHAYTEQFGSTSYLVSRATGRRSGGLRALFLPLSLLHLTTDHRQNREVQRVREAAILHAPIRPSIDPVANAVALFMAELLDKILRIGEADPTLFSFLAQEIRRIEGVEGAHLASFHLHFMVALSWRLGIMPDTEQYRDGFVLVAEEGRFRHPIDKSETEQADASSFLYRMLTMPEGESVTISRNTRNRLLTLLLSYFDHYFPGIAQMRSPGVLQTLFI